LRDSGKFVRHPASWCGAEAKGRSLRSSIEEQPARNPTHYFPMKRFDSKALYAALDAQREARHLSWMEVDGTLAMFAWLGVAVETFVRESDR